MKTPPARPTGRAIALLWLTYFIFIESAVLAGVAFGTGWPLWAWVSLAVASTVLFLAFSWDFVLLSIWVWARWKNIPVSDPVPTVLTPAQAQLADDGSARLAILLPAHKESETPESAALFELRLLALMRVCPARSTIHVLFDSPDTEAETEQLAIQRTQTNAALESGMPRLVAHEYRAKPRHLQSKPGSIYLWLQQNRTDYDFLIVVDADTSFTPRTPPTPADRDVVRRLLCAMLQTDPRPDLIQTNIQQIDPETITGWLEAQDGLSSPFYARVMSTIYGDQSPCFGHNFICRTEALWQHIRTDYLSHDMIEAASMAAHGGHCHFSPGTLTYEACEEPLPAWLKRDARWGRGCAQWLVFILQRPLPWRPRAYLLASISLYYTQIAAALALLLAALLVHQSGRALVASPLHAWIVLALILTTNLAPRIITGRRLHTALAAAFLRSIISFGTIWWRTLFFLISPFGKGWTPRAARGTPTASAVLASAVIMLPGSGAGYLIYILLPSVAHNLGTQFLRAAALALIASPILGAAVSIPFRKPQPATTLD